MRIGNHPNNLHLFLAAQWPGFLDGLDAAFVPYAEGRASAALLATGEIDICGTGSTPPILAQAEGADIAYLAASAPRPANGALVVGADAAPMRAADLRGRRIALLDGSFHTYLLARVLEDAGLALSDVVRVELSPAASMRALNRGEVDAWIAMAPHLDRALADGTIRLLARCGDFIPNRSVFWTLRGRLPDAALDRFVERLALLGQQIAADPDRAARLLAETDDPDDIGAWRRIVSARDWRMTPADAPILAEQQQEADILYRHGALPAPVSVAAAARRPHRP
ncbi:ABC transporter substrate-binding protein [Gluconacetobacter takamatsuzukensis]|uniref:ABC transporter substrate-binding protein n=2 Tax=Gluconacetobacter takamatsuzukensis TaxID=1286190 RepID=A0A7W4KEP6_9PROT|nr:ABC transporter substrate-binding protein [Gluconacetobacter takamatsuzukensis]